MGYSYCTIKLIHTLINPALEMAADDDIIRKNPAQNALSSDYGKPPEEKDILTLDQQKKLFSFMQESNVYNVYGPVFTVLLGRPLMPSAVNNVIYNVVDKYNKEEVIKAKKNTTKRSFLRESQLTTCGIPPAPTWQDRV